MAKYEPKTPIGLLIGMLIPIIAAIPPWTGRYCYINFTGYRDNFITIESF